MTGPLRTRRLVLRRWQDGDLEPFAALNAVATALGHAAIRRRHSVVFERADRLFKRLKASRLDNSPSPPKANASRSSTPSSPTDSSARSSRPTNLQHHQHCDEP